MAIADSPSTSPTLLRLLAGPTNEDAWRRFVEVYSPLIEERCRHAGLQPADVDEMRARVLAGLVTALKDFQYDPARSFRGYVRAAVNNCVRSYWRERARTPGAVGSGDSGTQQNLEQVELPAPVARLADELDESVHEDLKRVRRVLERVRAQVEPDTWQAYWRIAVEGERPAEVARSLGKTIAAVYMAKSRVGKLLLAEGTRETND